MEFSSLEKVLRSSEAEHFTRPGSAMLAGEYSEPQSGGEWDESYPADWDLLPEGAWWGDDWADDADAGGGWLADQGGWFADGDEGDPLAEDVDAFLSADSLDSDIFGYLARDADPADAEHAQSVDDAHAALVAWRDARRRLGAQRRARGFFPVDNVVQAIVNNRRHGKGRKGKSKGKNRKKGGVGSGKGFPRPSGGKGGKPGVPALPPGAPGVGKGSLSSRTGGRFKPRGPPRPAYAATESQETPSGDQGLAAVALGASSHHGAGSQQLAAATTSSSRRMA